MTDEERKYTEGAARKRGAYCRHSNVGICFTTSHRPALDGKAELLTDAKIRGSMFRHQTNNRQ